MLRWIYSRQLSLHLQRRDMDWFALSHFRRCHTELFGHIQMSSLFHIRVLLQLIWVLMSCYLIGKLDAMFMSMIVPVMLQFFCLRCIVDEIDHSAFQNDKELISDITLNHDKLTGFESFNLCVLENFVIKWLIEIGAHLLVLFKRWLIQLFEFGERF